MYEEFFDIFDLGKPVMIHWYYDGYYEDFSWEHDEIECPKNLMEAYGDVKNLNKRIQELKKEKGANYKREIDAVETEYGKISEAYMSYPTLSNKKFLQLICLYSQWCTLGKYNNITDLKEKVLNGFVKLFKSHDCNKKMGYYNRIQSIFNKEEE